MSEPPRRRYQYDPSQGAAVFACALFGLGLLISLFQTFKYKAWMWLVMVLAIGMETAGYASRIISAGDVYARLVWILQYCLIFLAPVLMAGIIYLVFGRIVFHVVPAEARTTRLLWVPARWLTPIFVAFDVITLFLQLIGGVIGATTEPTDVDADKKIKMGKDLAMAGVILQLVTFGLFSIISVRFHFTSRRFKMDFVERYEAEPGRKSVSKKYFSKGASAVGYNPHWQRLLYAVNISCLMILIRSVYREVDFSEGRYGHTQHYEYFTYVLEFLPMMIVVILFTIFPPGAYVPMGLRQQNRASSSVTSADGLVEMNSMA